jgi:nucleoside-diphosphate kinase
MEFTLVIIKPDAVLRGLVGDITSRFERKGLQLVDTRMTMATEQDLRLHYFELATKYYFPDIVKTMTMGRLVVQVWHGLNAVKVVRQLIGSTDPQDALPGTIRGDYAIHIGRNIVHASDSRESSERECSIWFENDTWVVSATPLVYRSEK